MGVCSNRRCGQPNAGVQGRCLTCNSLLVGKLVRDRYLVKEMVSRGGFGATYLVNDQDCFNEPRILKELRPSSKDESEENAEARKEIAERLFKREAETLLNLNHPGIPKLYAHFIQDDFSYLLQEYIPGRTLAETVDERKENLNEEEARALLAEIAEILRYLHAQQPPIIHRDIKPQNLMRHMDGRLLLIDFGAVCRAANQIGKSQTLIGSPGYASPEQIMGQPMPQSDLFAAGATIVRLLTGVHPSQLTNNRAERLEWESRVAVSRPFCDLINELLVRDPAKRLGSAAELIRWLKELAVVPPLPRRARSGATPGGADSASSTTLSDMGPGLSAPKRSKTVGIITALSQTPEVEIGSLRSVPVPVLLFRCYQKRLSGVLSFLFEDITKTIHFDQGAIVFASSSRKEERLSEQLLRRGRLTPEEFEAATRCVDRTSMRMGAALLQLGIITIDELTPLVVEHVSNLVYSLFEWTDGSYKFETCMPPSEAIKMPFSTADIIFEGIRRLENFGLIKQWLGDFSRPLHTTTDPFLLYQTVTLDPHEAFIVSRIDSAMSIEDLLSLGGLPENETLRTVCGLLAVGMLELVGESATTGELQPSTPVGNVLAHPSPLPQDFDFSTAAAFCYEVESKLRGIEAMDAYGVLEVDRSAGDGQISEAYKNLARKFHPDRHSQLLNYNLSLRADLEKIFQAVASAYEKLSTAEKRNNYNTRARGNKSKARPSAAAKSLIGKARSEPRPTYSKTGTASADSGSFDKPSTAQEWMRRGEECYRAGQYEKARIAFEKAVEMEPKEAEYHFQLARALAHQVGSFHTTESEFYRALELSPTNADYYAEFGLFYQRFSLVDRAESMFNSCLKISPNHPIAKRSLRA